MFVWFKGFTWQAGDLALGQGIVSLGRVALSDRITEWFGLDGALKFIQFQPSAMGRNTSH